MPPPLQVLFPLFTTLTTDYNVICKHYRPDLISQSVDHYCKQDGVKSRYLM